MVLTRRILRRLRLTPADKLDSAGQAGSTGQCRAADGQRNDCAFALALTTRSSDRMFFLSPVSFAIVLGVCTPCQPGRGPFGPAVTRFGAVVIASAGRQLHVPTCSVLQPPSLDDVTESADDVTVVD